jgi:hypothetical protein
MPIHKKVLFLLLLFFHFKNLQAQHAPDSSFTEAVAVYDKTVSINKHLYNGSEYTDFDHRIKGDPFYKSLVFATGTIVYDGILYNDVQLFYDIWNDAVVIKNYNGLPLLLVKEKISAFSLAGDSFVRISEDSMGTATQSGFYEVLYNGNTKLFARHKKTVVDRLNLQYTESVFEQTDSYYILKDDVLYQANDKRSALNIMKDKKNELAKFIHQNKVKFKKDKRNAFIKTVAFYDSLNGTK